MQSTDATSNPSFVRIIFGFIVGVLIFVIINYFMRPNILIHILSILVASDIAHLSNPRSTSIMGASIGVIFGLLYTISDVNAAFPGEMSLMELFLAIILVSCLFGIFYGFVGYIAGRLLKGYKESKGFFF